MPLTVTEWNKADHISLSKPTASYRSPIQRSSFYHLSGVKNSQELHQRYGCSTNKVASDREGNVRGSNNFKRCLMPYTTGTGVLFQSVQGTAVIDDMCAGCSTGAGSMRRVLLRKRGTLREYEVPIDGHQAFLDLRRTATWSSGYDSFYSRHSPHRRCYMLKSLRGGAQTVIDQPNVTKNPRDGDHGNEQRTSTLVTMDEPRP